MNLSRVPRCSKTMSIISSKYSFNSRRTSVADIVEVCRLKSRMSLNRMVSSHFWAAVISSEEWRITLSTTVEGK